LLKRKGAVGLGEKDTAHASTWWSWPTTKTLEVIKRN